MYKFIETLSRYKQIFFLLLSDTFYRYRKNVALIVASSLLGVGAQVGAIAILVYYVRLLENGESVSFYVFSFLPQKNLDLLLIVAACILIALVISAFLIYYSRYHILKLGRKYEIFCSKRILAILSSGCKIIIPKDESNHNDVYVIKLAKSYSRYCNRVLQILLSIFFPAVTLCFAFTTVIYYNPVLTMVLIVPGLIYIIFLYRTNVEAARNSMQMENTAGGAGKEFRALLEIVKSALGRITGKEPWLDNYYNTGATRKHLDAYEGRLRAVETSTFISNLFLAVCLFLVLLAMGGKTILQGQGWSELLVYVLALRFALVSLKQLTRLMTSINLFYPQFSRYFQFVLNSGYMQQCLEPCERYKLIVQQNSIMSELNQMEVIRGDRIGLVLREKVERITIYPLLSGIMPEGKQAEHVIMSSAILKSNFSMLPGSFREMLNLPEDINREQLVMELEKAGLGETVQNWIPKSLDTPVDDTSWNTAPRGLIMSLAFLSIMFSNEQWVFVEELGLRLLSKDTRDYFLRQLQDRILVVVYNDGIDNLGEYGEEIIAVVNENGLIALGDLSWFFRNLSKIQEELRTKKKENKNKDEKLDINEEMDEL